MSRLPRLLLLLLVLAVSPLALAACGSDDGGGDATPQKLLDDTFSGDNAVKSGRLDVALRLNLEGIREIQGPVNLNVTGPFASAGESALPNFDLSLNLSAGGQSFSAGAVSTGKKGFFKLQGQAFDVGDQLYQQFRKGYAEASKQSGAEQDKSPSFESLGIKPLNWLRNPTKAGEEPVGGADTIRLNADVDVKRFLGDVSRLLERAKGLNIQGAGRVPGGLSARQQAQIARAVKAAKLSVWTGKEDRTLRKLVLDLDLDVPADVRRSVGNLRRGTVRFALTIAELNEDQEIRAPRNARPLSELTGALGGLGGAGSGSDPGSGSQGSAAPTAPGGTPQAYVDCVQAAGQDVAKLQGCADLLK